VNNWQTLANKFNQIGPEVTTAEGKTFRIKLLLGTDAVHSNQHVIGTILFPHNSGLACTHNANNFYNLGYWTGVNVKNSGFNYAFAPTVAVSHNPQWGRFYESMGQDDSMIAEYAKQFVKGLQNIDTNGTWKGVLGSVKHFFGDGSTIHGADEG
jgi:beta-glucosidase